MKALRNILLSAFVTIAAFTAVVYTACKKDRCNGVACKNGGVCDGGNCTCLPGFEGDSCQNYSRDKFITNFNGGDSCGASWSDTVYMQYPIRFLTVAAKNQMMMKNILNIAADSALCTMVTTDSFIFNGANNSITYRGSGKMRNDSLWMSYAVQFDTSNYTCKYFGIRY